MNNQTINTLSENEYYHGTDSHKAIQILYEGFRLKKSHSNYGNSGTFKQGLYLTKSLSSASYFGPKYIYKCRLKKGVSIVWINKKYDKKVINYLKREFSKALLMGDISKAIPRNKHLTRNELIHLLNYRYSKAEFCSWQSSRKWDNWCNSISSFRQQLQLHKYDGLGEAEDLDGVVIFNPSLVEPTELVEILESEKPSNCWPIPSEELSLKKLDQKDFIKDIDQFYKENVDPSSEYNEPLTKEESKRWEYIRSLQEKYCKENGL